MKLSKDGTLSLGITYGYPFADNVLVDPNTVGELSSLIDIEDVCVGSLLFDLACCACFKESEDTMTSKYPQVLDFALLEALLEGYGTELKLPTMETQHFAPYIRLTLLCNCFLRFVKFYVDITATDVPDLEEATNSYLELKR